MNPAQWLERTALIHPARPALLSGSRVVADYATFRNRAAALGRGLQARGIGKGDRVVIFMQNCPQYLECLYGIWFAGAVAVPVNGKLHQKEALSIIRNAQASLVFSDATHSTPLGAVGGTGDPEIMDVGTSRFAALCAGDPLDTPVALDGDDLVWLFYTSGTTGRPKGVMLTAGNLSAMAHSYFADIERVTEDDAILYAAPMSHGAGIYNFMFVMNAARHVIPESGGFEPEEIFRLGRAVGNISMFAAPTMVRRMVDCALAGEHDGTGLRTVVYAGGPMYEADILQAVEVLGARFVQIYGQGECPMSITVLPREMVTDRRHPRWRARLNSVGYTQSHVQVAICDDDGNSLPYDQIGEIMVRGAPVMAGYWQNPEATAETIRNGWLRTGDVGSLDAEGFLTLRDRSKDVIISGGSNIYPREVEELLLQHEAVSEVAVIGAKDAEWGEIVVAFVVARTGAAVTEQDLDAYCIDNIARFKRPKIYRFVSELPKNNYGKVLKTDLRRGFD
ncbi:MAG: AMP-dependent synthetase [Rhodobacterales bacterium]|nr:MAG: AMP-dependent synthetase [Rhodobacterales bacterium]